MRTCRLALALLHGEQHDDQPDMPRGQQGDRALHLAREAGDRFATSARLRALEALAQHADRQADLVGGSLADAAWPGGRLITRARPDGVGEQPELLRWIVPRRAFDLCRSVLSAGNPGRSGPAAGRAVQPDSPVGARRHNLLVLVEQVAAQCRSRRPSTRAAEACRSGRSAACRPVSCIASTPTRECAATAARILPARSGPPAAGATGGGAQPRAVRAARRRGGSSGARCSRRACVPDLPVPGAFLAGGRFGP